MYGGYGYGPGSGMMGYSPWAGLFVFMFWLLFLVAIGLLAVWAIRQSRHDYPRHTMQPPGMMPPQPPMAAPPMTAPPQHDEAMAIARRRLAAGEITHEQFEALRKTLGG
jgi:uncharacterized membrane protein